MNEPWRQLAACKDMDMRIFFPRKGGPTERARRICARCPVVMECREAGMREVYGVWGGLDTSDRRVARRDRSRVSRSLRPSYGRPLASIPAHGFRSAYVAGCRCEPCTRAEAAYSWARKKARVPA